MTMVDTPKTAQPGHFLSLQAPGVRFAADEGFRKGTAPMVYWKKPLFDPNSGEPFPEAGWVVLSAEDDMRSLARVESGWIRLRQYGGHHPQAGWSAINDPYRPILELGGAKEFPVDQVLALNWHRKPPKGFTRNDFPQLEGVTLSDVQCRQAGCFRWFNNEEDYNKHYSVAHSKVAQNKDLAKALSESGIAANTPLMEFLKGLTGQQKEQQTFLNNLAETQKEQTRVLAELTKALVGLHK